MDNFSDNLQEKIPLVDRFRGAHGISSVTSIYISESDSSNVEIRTVTIESSLITNMFATGLVPLVSN